MIRNVVIHIANEQPLLADLFDMPVSADVSLVCTNVRMLDGKKPIFVDRSDSVFVFPYLHIRFVEIMQTADTRALATADLPPAAAEPAPQDDPDVELEIDEDFLRRIREV